MKVLIVGTTFYSSPPKSYAGTERVYYDLAVELNKLGHKVAVVAPKGSVFPEGIEHIATVEPVFGQMQEDAAWPMFLPRIVNLDTHVPTKEFDIVHENSFRMWSYMAAKDHPAVKVCATVHWQMHWPMVGARAPPVAKPNLICLSNAHALATSAALGMHVEYVYNGIDVSAFPFQKEKGDRFLFLGRIARFKAPHEAIALAEAHRFPIDVAGEDRFVNDPQYVHAVMGACKGFAKYWGEVSHETKLELLRNAKAVLLPYAWAEPFGIVPIEANACVPAGTAVTTVEGEKNIEEVQVGDLVFTHRGRYEPVLRVHKRRSPGGLTSVSGGLTFTDPGVRSLYLTDNHSLLTTHGWKTARDVRATLENGKSLRCWAFGRGGMVRSQGRLAEGQGQGMGIGDDRGADYRDLAGRQSRRHPVLAPADLRRHGEVVGFEKESAFEGVGSSREATVPSIVAARSTLPENQERRRLYSSRRLSSSDASYGGHAGGLGMVFGQSGARLSSQLGQSPREVAEVFGSFRPVPVKTRRVIGGNHTVYNLTVAQDNSYVAEGFVVHNCGTPAIGLDYPGSAMKEIIEDGVNGFLVKSFKEMGEATKNVGDIKPEECRRVVEEKFTARIMAENYVRLYERILKDGGW